VNDLYSKSGVCPPSRSEQTGCAFYNPDTSLVQLRTIINVRRSSSQWVGLSVIADSMRFRVISVWPSRARTCC